jgi:hypothetical protein
MRYASGIWNDVLEDYSPFIAHSDTTQWKLVGGVGSHEH